MGSGTLYAQRHRPGNEYIFEERPGWLTLATLGVYTRPWLHIKYPDVPPAVGRFEGDAFDPIRWKPEYPNPAFANMRSDDAFWAARIVSRFSDAAIRAIVAKARYTDPRASQYIADTLITRRDKVLRAWLTAVNPLVDFELLADGTLTFANAAVTAGVATAAEAYRVDVARFDNGTGTTTPLGSIDTKETRAALPTQIGAAAAGGYLEVRVTAIHPGYPAWQTPVTVHFRRTATGWQTVGVRRLP
jgi:hypothetical protein